MAKPTKPTKRGRPAPQNRGQKAKNRGQSSARKRRQGGKGKPFEKGQSDLPVGQRFEPGESGNPGGRPRSLKEVKEAIQLRGLDLVAKLLAMVDAEPQLVGKVMVGPSDDTKRLVIRDLLDRGYGRPVQAVEVSGPGGGAISHRDITQLTSTERRQRLNDLLVKAGSGVAVVGSEAAADGGEDEDDRDDADAGGG